MFLKSVAYQALLEQETDFENRQLPVLGHFSHDLCCVLLGFTLFSGNFTVTIYSVYKPGLNGYLMMRKPGLILFFIANITFNGASVSWGKNAAYCETTQVLEIDEHALAKSKNEQFRLVISNETVHFGINSFSGGSNTFKIIDYRGKMNWRADDDRYYISFLNGNLYFSAVFPKSATVVSARCEIY